MRSDRFHDADEAFARDLVADQGWATIVSSTSNGPVASHYPVMLDDGDDFALLTHVGRPDERHHEFEATVAAGRDVLVIVQGTHGYISPSW